MVRKILRRIRISELSTVDNPAQEGALAVLIKRDGTITPDDIFAKAAADAALPLEKRMELIDTVNEAVEEMAKAIKSDDESIEQATERLFRTNPALYAATDQRLRELGGG